MKRKGYTLLMAAFALMSVLMTVVAVNAKPLYGEMALFKPPIGPPHPAGSLSWSGTISGDINGKMFFYNTGREVVGNVKHFWEVWLITDDAGDMLLMGTDKGVVTLANMKYRMNGVVTDAAPQYEHLIGRNVHVSGCVISLGSGVKQAPGVFRVMPSQVK